MDFHVESVTAPREQIKDKVGLYTERGLQKGKYGDSKVGKRVQVESFLLTFHEQH